MARHRSSLALAILMMAVAALSAGCSILGASAQTRSVSDAQNMFHFKVPAQWQTSVEGNMLTVYGGKKLPAPGETASELSVLVLTSQEASTAPTSKVVDYLLTSRAAARGWKNVERSKPQTVTVGGRDAYSVDVTATKQDGKTFETRYLFVRTGGKETFLVAVAPDGKHIADYTDRLEQITSQWYWHFADKPQQESTASAEVPAVETK